MNFSFIEKLANKHLNQLFSSKFIKNKKRNIAKYSFIAGFKAAMLLLDEKNNNRNAPIRIQQEQNEETIPESE